MVGTMAWISDLFTNLTLSRFYVAAGIALAVYGFADFRELDSKTNHALRVLVVEQTKVAREIRTSRSTIAAESLKLRHLWMDASALDAENSVLESQKRTLAVESEEGQKPSVSATALAERQKLLAGRVMALLKRYHAIPLSSPARLAQAEAQAKKVSRLNGQIHDSLAGLAFLTKSRSTWADLDAIFIALGSCLSVIGILAWRREETSGAAKAGHGRSPGRISKK